MKLTLTKYIGKKNIEQLISIVLNHKRKKKIILFVHMSETDIIQMQNYSSTNASTMFNKSIS